MLGEPYQVAHSSTYFQFKITCKTFFWAPGWSEVAAVKAPTCQQQHHCVILQPSSAVDLQRRLKFGGLVSEMDHQSSMAFKVPDPPIGLRRGGSDTSVQGTNDDAQVSKLSCVRAGYFKDEYLHHFVRKPSRRSPMINRGYYSRYVGSLRRQTGLQGCNPAPATLFSIVKAARVSIPVFIPVCTSCV